MKDPEYDAYKRGAFLEKTNRFAKDKASDVPGPGTYDPDGATSQSKAPTMNSTGMGAKSFNDRYAVLQRKLEDLERVHTEGKKTHHLELERVKLELARAQRSAAESAERADKLKKAHDALDGRVQELKRAGASDQSELRELRVKLRTAEAERAQLASKQSDAGEARKALAAAESRRKDELRERDRKIAELERALAAEKKKREGAEARVAEVRGKIDGEKQEARATVSGIQAQLQGALADAQEARTALEGLQTQAVDREEELLEKLEQHRVALSRVAEEYARLASTTVSKSAHVRVQDEAVALRLRIFRLERKLANSDGQVTELVNLVRHTMEENAFLKGRLREAESDVAQYAQLLKDTRQEQVLRSDLKIEKELERYMLEVDKEFAASRKEKVQAILTDIQMWATLHRLRGDAMVLHSSVLLKGLDDADAQSQRYSSLLSDAQTKHAACTKHLEETKQAQADALTRLAETDAALQTARAAEAAVKAQLEANRVHSLEVVAKSQQQVQQEREANRRLANTLQQSRVAQQALQSDIDQLSEELLEAQQYQDAYNNLVEEVDALVARNALAEEEAARLSKFNAEIVGHNNPAQRIVYVDKIRRELHETKQKLLTMTRDRDAVLADNGDLQHELQLYKSVAVPPDLKPRTNVTRVGRAPSQTHSASVNGHQTASTARSAASARRLEPLPETHFRNGDMTLDEII
ncbi:hypothetical protein WOLCODRAFT_156905 [Wolfiporia cocos MD-104 SS10]|uniref:Hyaluronan-mediated motility receptor C-terminal domain-containing protein n=1 Tax=Wolfiporia cocos (strain MD-104) TaxID=742152 RepID=A0A2H3J2H5_WOLCO|nr:hypothetical protein WOLCODRAFT_156905 [Wolfiporia cocos MD-104 SS10]